MNYKTKDNNERKQISIYLDLKTLNELDNLAKEQQRNRNDLLRLVLRDYIKSNSKGLNNEQH